VATSGTISACDNLELSDESSDARWPCGIVVEELIEGAGDAV